MRCPAPIVELFYPSRCGICGLLGDLPICSICEAGFVGGDAQIQSPEWRGALKGVARLYRYEGRAEQAVRRLKFARATVLARPMSEMLADYAQRTGLAGADLVVPVPIHWTRRMQRGFNQSELLCESFSGERVNKDLLRRIRATRPQVGLTPEERRSNLTGAFGFARRVDGMSILLLDDVITTGHTVGECARTLRAAGAAEVYAMAFCGS